MTQAWLHDTPPQSEPPEAPGGQARRVSVPPSDVVVRNNPPDSSGAAANQWTPLGPSVTLDGQATGRPRVSGRVRALKVSPDGRRVYAGSALGGVWYSNDGGDRWASLDFYASTRDESGNLKDSNALSVGAVAVRWVDGAHDLVLVGTGERPPNPIVNDFVALQGVGIRVASGPAEAVRIGGPAADPWKLEATNLAGQAVSQLAFDRVNPDVVWAATSIGLYRRPATGSRDTWEHVDAGFGAAWVSDVVVVPGLAGEPQRIYAVSATGRLARSTDGTHWQPVALPPDPTRGAVPTQLANLAAGNDPARPIVWVLAGGPQLWRVDADAAEVVAGLPADLFGTTSDQTDYDLAVAVHPSIAPGQRDLVAVGGSVTSGPQGDREAGLYAGKVTRVGGGLVFPTTPGPTAPPGASGAQRGEWIGQGVHADVHAIVWVGAAVPAQMWIACDGGVFRSMADGSRGSFTARNTGLATLETYKIAQHQRLPGLLLAGSEDNGALRSVGATTWRVARVGDAGGVAIDPATPARMYHQRGGARWFSSDNAGASFTRLNVFSPSGAAGAKAAAWRAAQDVETDSPVAALAVIANETAARGTQLVLGTNRAWYRDDVTIAAAAGTGTGWVTLPTATDPYAPALAAPATAQDVLDSLVTGLEWADPDRLYILTQKSVYALRRAAGVWAAPQHLYDQSAVHRNWKGKLPCNQVPDDVTLLELAVHDPAHGAAGSLYLGVKGESDGHNLWWYDGTSAWRHTGLTVYSPVNAVVVDPTDRTVVYAGTDVGVFRGIGTFPASGDPAWAWTTYSDGLPEAACYDLILHVPMDDGPRLLRAALAGRGIWEVPVDGTLQGPVAYLRAHDLDLRRGPVPAGGPENPLSPSRTQERLDASPDIRIWRADTTSPPVPAKLPVDAASPEYDKWLLQSALRAGGEDVPVDSLYTPDVGAALARRTAALTPPLPPAPTPQQVWAALWAGNRLPFDASPPDAADLLAHLRERPDTDPKGARASCLADDGIARIFITVHGRHWKPLDGARVQVALLRTPFGRHANLAGTPPLPFNWTTNLAADRTSAIPGIWLNGSGWEYVDTIKPFRSLPDRLDPDNPQVVFFDADLAGPAWVKPGWLLLAVVVADDDMITTAETDVARLVTTDRHVAARSVRRSHASIPPMPPTLLLPGMDQGNYGGLPAMDRAWESSNLYWTGLYLDSPRPAPGEVPVPPGVVAGHNRLGGTPGHPAGSWMAAWPQLWPGWGIAPIYWGQQDPANAQGPFDLRPVIAVANAEDAAAKATAAGIPAGAVIYLDWETGGAPGPAGVTYCRTFFERLAELGHRPGLYAHAAASAAFRREVPGLFVWSVRCQRNNCQAVAADRTLVGGRLWYAPVPIHPSDPDAIARQWAFEGTQPAGSPLLPFANIDHDVAIVADPAFPERLPQPALVRPGSVAIAPAAAPAAVAVVRMLRGRPVRVTWAPRPVGAVGVVAPDAAVGGITAAHWWNPFSPSAAVQVPSGGAARVDWVFALGYEHRTAVDPLVLKAPAFEQMQLQSIELGPDGWRVQALERGLVGWRVTTVADGGLVIDPLGGVAAAVRANGVVEVLVLTTDGTPATARLDPVAHRWSALATVCAPGSAPARSTCRPALVWRAPDVLDAIWLGTDGRLRATRSNARGVWAVPEAIGDPAVQVHPQGNLVAVSVAADRVDVAYLGRAGVASPWSVFVTSWTIAEGWGGAAHTTAAGAGTALSPLSRIGAASRAPGVLDVVAVAATGELVVTSRPTPAGAWTALTAIGGTPAVAGGATLRVAAVEGCVPGTGGALTVGATGREGGVWITRFDPGTSVWSTLERLGALDPV